MRVSIALIKQTDQTATQISVQTKNRVAPQFDHLRKKKENIVVTRFI
jgi:hypothetical protein